VATDDVLDRLEGEGLVIFKYADADGNISADANPNGSERNIAGIINETGNVLGMMPHPERACSLLLGSEDGVRLLESILSRVAA
jgi:phosphoribosylformylglycinamidine synthase